MKVSADVADSPASFQPLNAHTSAGARSPSGRRSQRSGCMDPRYRVRARAPVLMASSTSPSAEVTVAGLRAGDAVDAVFACSRKDRLTARSGTPYLALELRDRTGAIQAPRVPRRRPAARAASSAAISSASPAASSASATSCRSTCAAIARAEEADPAAFLPVAYRDLDELDGFLEHLAREVHDPAYRGLLERLLGDEALRAAVAARAVHPRRPSRLPRRAAGAHGRGWHAGARVRPAAPASESGPAAHARRSCTTSARRASSPTAPRSG